MGDQKTTLHLPVAAGPSATEVRLRCLEAAARNPDPRNQAGMAASVLNAAQQYAAWVLGGEAPKKAV